MIPCLTGPTDPNFWYINLQMKIYNTVSCKHVPKRNGEKGEMAAATSYAWPSVVVYRGAMVVKRRTIVKCNWSDNFGVLLEKLGHVLHMTSHPFLTIFIFLFSFLSHLLTLSF